MVDPIALITHKGTKYLLAFCNLRGKAITFRVDRISVLTLTSPDAVSISSQEKIQAVARCSEWVRAAFLSVVNR